MKILFSLGIFAFVVLNATASFAIAKTIGGAACQSQDDSDVRIGRSQPGFPTVGAAGARSMYGDFYVSCPIVRDNTVTTAGLSLLEIRVTKGDATTRTCSATSSDGFGGNMITALASASGTGIKAITWNSTNKNALNSSNSLSTYTVNCSFGANDVVQNVYWVEADVTESSDRKTISAAAAKPTTMNQYLSRGSYGLWTDSTVNGAVFQLPLLRDQFGSNTMRSLTVRLNHGSPAYTPSCTAVISDNHWDPKVWAPKFATSALGDQTLTWTSAELNLSFTTGFFDVTCDLGTEDFFYGASWGE